MLFHVVVWRYDVDKLLDDTDFIKCPVGGTASLIQGRFIFRATIGLMAYCLFHTLAWWQQEFLARVMTVSHEVKTGAGRS